MATPAVLRKCLETGRGRRSLYPFLVEPLLESRRVKVPGVLKGVLSDASRVKNLVAITDRVRTVAPAGSAVRSESNRLSQPAPLKYGDPDRLWFHHIVDRRSRGCLGT